MAWVFAPERDRDVAFAVDLLAWAGGFRTFALVCEGLGDDTPRQKSSSAAEKAHLNISFIMGEFRGVRLPSKYAGRWRAADGRERSGISPDTGRTALRRQQAADLLPPCWVSARRTVN